jgi:methylated-DNA-[protein]-cysteine S-methyltransferase
LAAITRVRRIDSITRLVMQALPTETIFKDYYNSPIGFLEICSTAEVLLSLTFCTDALVKTEHLFTQQVKLQLDEYFEGTRKEFAIPLQPKGTIFQLKVWELLKTIPFGTTTTYQKQAIQLGDVKAIRAMASANGKNPIAILVPCHRVIGSDGSLTGYAGALWRKQWLLEHEAKCSGKWNQLF